MSKFHNLSSRQIADDLGETDARIKALTEHKDALKDELKKRGDERVEGDRWTVTLAASARTTYDDKAIRAALGEEIVKQYERGTETTTLRVKPTVVFGQEAE